MSRVRVATVAVVTALAVTGLSGVATAATTTASSGSLLVQEDSAFLQKSAAAGIVAVALPSATADYSRGAGLSASFPVTAGSVSLSGYYGTVQLGGGLLLINVKNGKFVIFKHLAFSADNWAITGIPAGHTTPVNLFDPASSTITNGATQTLVSSDLQVDADGAKYLDAKLKSTFFVAGQHTGGASLTFTAGS